VGVVNRITIFFLSTLLLLFTSCGLRYEREQDENDSFFTSQPVSSGKPIRASIFPEGDVDFYKISPKQSIQGDMIADISLEETETLDLVLKIYRGNKLVKTVNDSEGVGRGERIVNVLFAYDEIMDGNAIFSVEETGAGKPEEPVAKKRYELSVQLRQKEETDEGEPNDRAVDAIDFGASGTIRGYFNPSVYRDGKGAQPEEDWFAFSISGTDERIIHVGHTSVPDVDSTISIFDEFGYLIRKADSHGKGEPEKIKNVGLVAGRYFIQLRSSVPFQQNYRVSYLLKLEHEADEGRESESNDKYPYADLIKFSSDTRGCFNPRADIDWFRFIVYDPERQVVSVRVSPTADIDPVIELYSASMEQLLHVDDRGYDEGEIIKNMGVEEGVYYVKLFNKDEDVDNPDNEYTLFVEKNSWDDEQEFERNDDRMSANELKVNGLKKGYITPRGDRDFYLFRVTDGSILRFEITPCVLLDLAIQIYDENGQLIQRIDENPAEEGERGSMFFNPGLYYGEILSNNIEENSRDTYFFRIYKTR
jgi:hypothetical protein